MTREPYHPNRFTLGTWTGIALGMAVAYFVLLHVVLVAYAASSTFRARAYALLHGSSRRGDLERHLMLHRWIDQNVPAGSAIFLGDSITEGLATAAVADRSVNFGVGGETTGELLSVLPEYQSMARAGTIHLEIGINDFVYGQSQGLVDRYRQILAALPSGTPLVWSSIMPTESAYATPAQIQATNREIRALCAERPRCSFVDTWALMADSKGVAYADLFQEDGVHLTPRGYQVWIEAQSRADSRRMGT